MQRHCNWINIIKVSAFFIQQNSLNKSQSPYFIESFYRLSMWIRKGWHFTWHVQRSLTYITCSYLIGEHAYIKLKCSYTVADNERKYSDMPAYTFTPTLVSRRRGFQFWITYHSYVWGLKWVNKCFCLTNICK